MNVGYRVNAPVDPEEFAGILRRSGLAERRPVDDQECIRGMIENSNLTVTAWDGVLLVGIARSVTDFCYCCYLSDLAVDRAYQRRGMGTELLSRTRKELGPRCKLILLSAPGAVAYYECLGLERHPQAFVLARNARLGVGLIPPPV
ncbi:MAG: GNAT family N-acetyltransferase [Candidatus Schekmanbacteria bacterium]|nr:GNAT family N-acetyltransferase [Candidatus Schekmanbacteria bacterium]